MKLTEGIGLNRVRAVDLNFTVITVMNRLNETEWYRQGIELRTDETRNRAYYFALRMVNGNCRGAAVTLQGRRSHYACWHTHRDMMMGIFALRPIARLVSSIIRYDGADGFRDRFVETYYDQVGGASEMATRGCLCACDMGARVYHPSVRKSLERLGAAL